MKLKRLKDMGVELIRRGLEELIKSIDLELAKTEARLTAIAEKFGLNSWEELDYLFKRGIDNPEIDLAWAEYCYLKGRRESLSRDRGEAFQLLSGAKITYSLKCLN